MTINDECAIYEKYQALMVCLKNMNVDYHGEACTKIKEALGYAYQQGRMNERREIKEILEHRGIC